MEILPEIQYMKHIVDITLSNYIYIIKSQIAKIADRYRIGQRGDNKVFIACVHSDSVSLSPWSYVSLTYRHLVLHYVKNQPDMDQSTDHPLLIGGKCISISYHVVITYVI